MRFGVYFETKMAIIIKKITIVYLHVYLLVCYEVSYSSRKIFGKACHNLCVLVIYFDCILNEKMVMLAGSFHIETMISAAHMLRGMLPCEKTFKKCAI